jgi:uncharacterized membrane protein
MSYRPRSEFDKPTAESVQRSRRSLAWFLPLIMIQQGTTIFREGADRGLHVVGLVAWACVSLAILWMLLGLPMRWLSERDQTILNDERNRSVTGDASRWGMVATVGLGFAILIARAFRPIEGGIAVYVLVNGALFVAVCRYAWLNRAEPEEDE